MWKIFLVIFTATALCSAGEEGRHGARATREIFSALDSLARKADMYERGGALKKGEEGYDEMVHILSNIGPGAVVYRRNSGDRDTYFAKSWSINGSAVRYQKVLRDGSVTSRLVDLREETSGVINSFIAKYRARPFDVVSSRLTIGPKMALFIWPETDVIYYLPLLDYQKELDDIHLLFVRLAND